VTSGSPRDGGPPGPAEQDACLVLELTLADGDPLRGTVGVPGRRPAVPFCGWIDLMSAVNSLRAEAVRPPAEGR
jgi:hypothetical protein